LYRRRDNPASIALCKLQEASSNGMSGDLEDAGDMAVAVAFGVQGGDALLALLVSVWHYRGLGIANAQEQGHITSQLGWPPRSSAMSGRAANIQPRRR